MAFRVTNVWREAKPERGGDQFFIIAQLETGSLRMIGPASAPSAERFLKAYHDGIPLDEDDALTAQRAAGFEKSGPKEWMPRWRPERKIKFTQARETRMKEVRAKIKEDYKAVKGRVILVSELYGYINDDSRDFVVTPRAKVRVVNTSDDSLFHQNEKDWIDPYWELELVEPHRELNEARSLWMYGTSYNLKTGKVEPARFEFVSE